LEKAAVGTAVRGARFQIHFLETFDVIYV